MRQNAARLMLVATPPLLTISPLIEAISTLDIPFDSAQVVLLLGKTLVVTLFLGALCAAAYQEEGFSSMFRKALWIVLFTAGALIAIDVLIGIETIASQLPGYTSGRAIRFALRMAIIMGLAISVAALVWAIGKRIVPIAFAGALGLFVSTVATNIPTADASPSSSEAATDQPPFVYLVLDQAMGIEGLKHATPAAQAVSTKLRDLFLSREFRVYGQAYSRHYSTGRSVPNSLNFDFSDDTFGPHLRHATGRTVNSVLFDGFSQRGYKVVVFQTEHIDFCGPSVTRCETLPSFNPTSQFVTNTEVRAVGTQQVLRAAFRGSYAMRGLNPVVASSLPPFQAIDPFVFPEWFNFVSEQITSDTRGHLTFAHLLMPHSPYMLGADCSVTGLGGEGAFLKEIYSLKGDALQAERALYYDRYAAQYECAIKKVAGLLDRIGTDSRFQNATILIQGDHGSRISSGQFIEGMTQQDIIDNYSTLFAVRKPGIEPGYDLRKVSVQRLMAELFSPTKAHFPDTDTIAIDSSDLKEVVPTEMPVFALPAM